MESRIVVNKCWECGSLDIYIPEEDPDNFCYTCQNCGYAGSKELPRLQTREYMLDNNKLRFIEGILRRNIVLTTGEIANKMGVDYQEAKDFLNSIPEYIAPVNLRGLDGWVWAQSKEEALSRLAGVFRGIFKNELRNCRARSTKPFPYSTKKLQEIIRQNFPEAVQSRGFDNMPNHLLWMTYEVTRMDNRRKAGRWIGYVLGWLEANEIITNEESRNIVRVDAHCRND